MVEPADVSWTKEKRPAEAGLSSVTRTTAPEVAPLADLDRDAPARAAPRLAAHATARAYDLELARRTTTLPNLDLLHRSS
jgi:hypothetical protein